MNRLAIEILEAARDVAAAAPIKPDIGVRLALAWLALNRVADPFQIERYWQGLTKPPFDANSGPRFRAHNMDMPLEAWRANASGLMGPR